MKIIILCEGKSDAILISYLLEKLSGWTHAKKPDKKMNIVTDEKRNESAFWYTRNDDRLLICGVGGKDNFTSFFSTKVFSMIDGYPKAHTFDKIIVLRDKDVDDINNIEKSIQCCLEPISVSIKNDMWVNGRFKDSFGDERMLEILALIIPFENDGALENVLLDSLKEDEKKFQIVEESEKFVDKIKDFSRNYIINVRMELKAKLGVAFAVLSPMKVFSFIDEIIRTVEWEKSENIKKLFEKIINL